jgi:hypothetical protein
MANFTIGWPSLVILTEYHRAFKSPSISSNLMTGSESINRKVLNDVLNYAKTKSELKTIVLEFNNATVTLERYEDGLYPTSVVGPELNCQGQPPSKKVT